MKKNKRRSNKRKKGSPFSDLFLILAVIIFIGMLIGAGFYLFLNTEKKYALDQDLCPKVGSIATVAVLIDTTDELAEVTKTEVSKKIETVLKALPRYYRLSVYIMDENGLQKAPVITACNPGSSNNLGQLAQRGLTANPAMINKKFDQFSDMVEQSIVKVYSDELEARQSPLLGSLQELSLELAVPLSWKDLTALYGIKPANLRSFLKKINQSNDIKFPDWLKSKYQVHEENFLNWVKENNNDLIDRNKIIFVTDLFEHTDVFSVYETGTSFDAFKGSRASEKFCKQYSKTDLEFWVVRRNINGIKALDLKNFWMKVMKAECKSDIRMLQLIGEN